MRMGSSRCRKAAIQSVRAAGDSFDSAFAESKIARNDLRVGIECRSMCLVFVYQKESRAASKVLKP